MNEEKQILRNQETIMQALAVIISQTNKSKCFVMTEPNILVADLNKRIHETFDTLTYTDLSF